MSSGLAIRVKKLFRRRRGQSSYRLVAGREFGEEVRIDSLIWPLRYDIIVRAEFMDYYRNNRDTYRNEVSEFLDHPVAKAYFKSWLSDASRSRPWIGRDQEFLQRTFLARMERALALCDSLELSGYDNAHPIELSAASTIVHEHNKDVERRLYASDGCHRLAHLLLQGNTSLAPSQYCVRVFEKFRPRDNTHLLLGDVIRTERQYCEFISNYYCNGVKYEDPQGVLEHVELNCPTLRDEVTSVMRADLNRLAEMSDCKAGTAAEWSGRGYPSKD